MKRLWTAVAATGVIFIGAQTHAGDVINQSPTSKHEMIARITDCMKKRMSADKSISYNEARKICKNQMDPRDDKSSGALVASDTQAKP